MDGELRFSAGHPNRCLAHPFSGSAVQSSEYEHVCCCARVDQHRGIAEDRRRLRPTAIDFIRPGLGRQAEMLGHRGHRCRVGHVVAQDAIDIGLGEACIPNGRATRCQCELEGADATPAGYLGHAYPAHRCRSGECLSRHLLPL